jgi:ubiquinol-cytochrome c reductase iron-sulfur subunit
VPTDADGGPPDPDVLRRATRVAAAAFVAAAAAGVGLVYVYWVGGLPRIEGLLLFVAFGGIAVGLTLWAKVLLDEPEVEEERPPMRSSEEDRRAFGETYEGAVAAEREPGRRRFLTRLLIAASAALGVALVVPFRSLGERPGLSLFHTRWDEGARVVGFDGDPLRPADLAVGSVVTVFPEDHIGAVDSQVVLIRVDPDAFELPEGAPEPIDGVVAFSKICTHAGCPVGLFRAAAGELFCPCHQSLFDVFRGAEPISGPAARALPQLALGTDDDGHLVALRDFDEPVGPAFWNMRWDRGAG